MRQKGVRYKTLVQVYVTCTCFKINRAVFIFRHRSKYCDTPWEYPCFVYNDVGAP